MNKKQECDHLVGYVGSEDAIKLAHASDKYTFEDFQADGVMFKFCPDCGQPLKCVDPEAE